MSMKDDVATFEAKLNQRIEVTMVEMVLPKVKDALQEAIETEVYEKYTPTLYERRRDKDGGLQDRDMMKFTYDNTTNTLEVKDLSRANADSDYMASDSGNTLGRLVAPVVESGEGYTWTKSKIYKKQPFPRPFHEAAERQMKDSGEFERQLEIGLKGYGLM